MTFLEEDPSPERLLRAMTANMTGWMRRQARAGGGEIRRHNDVVWYRTPVPGGENSVAFPRLSRQDAAECIDAIVADFRAQDPPRPALWWSLDPPEPADLGVRLIARGFNWNWQPRWMHLDFRRMREDWPVPEGLRIELIQQEEAWEVEDLPYYDRTATDRRAALIRSRPRRVWRFAAWLDERPVGHSALHLTTGPMGLAGIFDVGVVPAARQRGIGKAVVLAACRYARSRGCRHAVLNATGERMYRQVGFEPIGWGRTWFLRESALRAPRHELTQIALAEAVGRGDLFVLNALAAGMPVETLEAPLANGLTPIQIAVRSEQPAAAGWLAARGATPDAISAWDMGWRDQLSALLTRRPDLVNARSGDWQITPLHEAVMRNDADLARVLLAAGADLTVQDTQFHGTPAGWARHLQRPAILAMIESAAKGE